MSDQTAPLPVVPSEPRRPRSRWGTVAVVASVVAVLVIAGGGFAAWRFLAGGGPRPAEVLPDSTFAVVSVDLDPSGGQKLEAIKTLRKFPSFRDHTDVNADSDLVKALYDETVGKECKEISYADDIKPWIGQRAAVAGVELDKGKPLPAVALQVRDKEAARAGLAKLATCAKKSDSQDFGYAVGDDYAIASDSTAHAQTILAAGQKSPLSEDATYQKWTDAAGGAGILNVYVSPKVADSIQDLVAGRLGSELRSGGDSPENSLQQGLKKFRGAAASLKFDNGGLDLAFASGTTEPITDKASVGDHVGSLPRDTALVLAGAVSRTALDQLEKSFGSGDSQISTLIEEETGLSFPDDVATLLGDSFSLSVGGDAPDKLSSLEGPGDIPIGALVHGDANKIKAIIEKVEAHTHLRLADIPATLTTSGDKVAVATTPDYADDLLKDGSLGDDEVFRDVVPHAVDSPFVLFTRFDNGWGTAIAEELRASGDEQERELGDDVAALQGLGISVWQDGGTTTKGLLRITLR